MALIISSYFDTFNNICTLWTLGSHLTSMLDMFIVWGRFLEKEENLSFQDKTNFNLFMSNNCHQSSDIRSLLFITVFLLFIVPFAFCLLIEQVGHSEPLSLCHTTRHCPLVVRQCRLLINGGKGCRIISNHCTTNVVTLIGGCGQ